MSKDFYATLEVSRTATTEEVRKAYRRLALIYHEDKQIGADEKTKTLAKQKFAAIQEAYEVLNNPEEREIYDARGIEGLKPENRPQKMPVPAIQVKVPVSLTDFYCGKTIDISVPIQATCDDCHGKGTLDGKPQVVCSGGITIGGVHSGGCGGKGMVMVARWISPGMLQQSMQPCTKCGGTGMLVEERNKCKKCLGKKMIIKQNQFKLEIEPGMCPQQLIVCAEKGHQLPKQPAGDVHVVLVNMDTKQSTSSALPIKPSQTPNKEEKMGTKAPKTPNNEEKEEGKDEKSDDEETKEEKSDDDEEEEEDDEENEDEGIIRRDEVIPSDLRLVKKITLLEALLGFEFSFVHLDGRRLICRSPDDHIFNHGEEMVLAGFGMPVWKRPGSFGDLIVKFHIIMPSPSEISRLRVPKAAKQLRNLLGQKEEKIKEAASEAASETLTETADVEAVVGKFLCSEEEEIRKKQKLKELGQTQDIPGNLPGGVPGAQCRQM